MADYFTSSDLKSFLSITGTAQDAQIAKACAATTELIDEYKRLTTGRRVSYTGTVETRYYTPEHCHDSMLSIDDVQAITALSIDRTCDYSYSESWAARTDYVLEPANNLLESKPQRTVVRVPRAGRYFPDHPQSVRVTGTFGWGTIPAAVQQAASILAVALFLRKDSPYGVLSVGLDAGAAARIPRLDPDVARLLDSVDSDVPRTFA